MTAMTMMVMMMLRCRLCSGRCQFGLMGRLGLCPVLQEDLIALRRRIPQTYEGKGNRTIHNGRVSNENGALRNWLESVSGKGPGEW